MSSLQDPQHVVVPVDFSEESFRAVDTAIEIAGNAGSVYLIHVLPELLIAEPGIVWDQIDDESRKQSVLSSLKEKLHDAKYKDVHLEVQVDAPGHAIVDYAESISADLIIMPSHGRTGIKRWLIGSVAERVLRLAHCPVLILRDAN